MLQFDLARLIDFAPARRVAMTVGLLMSIWLTGCASTPLSPASEALIPAATPAASDEGPAAISTDGVPASPAGTGLTLGTPVSPPTASISPLRPVDALRPEVILDMDDKSARTDLWARVRRGFAMPDLDDKFVRDKERFYASKPDYVQRMTLRGSRYLFHIVEEVERRGMPTELALLPFIESAFDPRALSSAKASGIWQFMPATGKDFDLKQNMFTDDRRDVLASTRAALDYLQYLHGLFGDWHLALSAYNWGQGSVQRAIARNQKAGLPTDYSSLSMPLETRHYVPKLQAIKNIVAQPAAFSLTLPVLENHPYFVSVPIDRDIDVARAAQLAGLGLDEFKSLNPQMNKPVILAAGTSQVLLPYDNANRFVKAMTMHRGPLASWTAWVVPKTMSPAIAASQVGMNETALREVNLIPPRMLVKAGSTLLVPRSEHRLGDVPEHVADNAAMFLSPDRPAPRRLVIKAGAKDSVASIARRYRVAASEVARWNEAGVSSRFKAGQSVVVYVAHAPKGKASPARSQTASSSKSAVRKKTVAAQKPTSKPSATAKSKAAVKVAKN